MKTDKYWRHKKITGGGDEQIARRNFDRYDTYFKIDLTLMMMGNNLLRFDTKDCMEHCIHFQSVYQFKTQQEINNLIKNRQAELEDEIEKLKEDYSKTPTKESDLETSIQNLKTKNQEISELLIATYKTKDPLIKSKCETEAWKKATIYLIFQHYVDEALVIDVDAKDTDDDELTLRQRILEYYEITRDQDDIISVADVVDCLTDCKNKITGELESMGITKKKCTKRGGLRNKICFYGMKSRDAGGNTPVAPVDP